MIITKKILLTIKIWNKKNEGYLDYEFNHYLKKNFLVGANVYSSFAYDQKAINKFSDAVHKVFNIIKKAIKSGQPNDFLDSEEKHSGFKRLT